MECRCELPPTLHRDARRGRARLARSQAAQTCAPAARAAWQHAALMAHTYDLQQSPCAIAALNASAHVSARQATQHKSPLACDVARAVLSYSPCTCIATSVRFWTATSADCAQAWHGCRRLKEQRGRAGGVEHSGSSTLGRARWVEQAARKCGGASRTQKCALSYAAALCGSAVHRDRAGMNPSARGR